jgi:hypothetical protein
MRRFRQPMGPARKVTRSATSNSPSETRKGGPNGGRPPTSDNASCRTSVQEMHEDGNADQARGSHAQRHQFKMQSATGRRHVGSALPFNGATYVPGRVAACYSVPICCFALTKLASFDGLPDRPRGLLLGGGRAGHVPKFRGSIAKRGRGGARTPPPVMRHPEGDFHRKRWE